MCDNSLGLCFVSCFGARPWSSFVDCAIALAGRFTIQLKTESINSPAKVVVA